jgi:hypothetical protein
VFTNTKIILAAVLILGAASQAMASENALAFNTCPTLEGYPDCHPDGGASWTPYSATSESMAQKKGPAKFKGMPRERKPQSGGAIPAPM